MAYQALAGSPSTVLASNIAAVDTSITVSDASAFSGMALPNLLTIGYTRNSFETVKVTAINSNTLTVQRGVEGAAQAWNSGTEIARTFTALDWNTLIDEINVSSRIFTAASTTAASTAAKVATLDVDTGFSLTAGVIVAVRFQYGNTATTPTLRVDGSSTGTAKTIAIPSSATEYTTGNGTTYNTWGAGETILFTYTGTYWTHIPSGLLGYLAYNLANGKQDSIGTVSGILKGNGSGGISAATAGTDYQAPLTAGTDYQVPLTAGTDYEVPLTAGTNITRTGNTLAAAGLRTVMNGSSDIWWLNTNDWFDGNGYKKQFLSISGMKASYDVAPHVDVYLNGVSTRDQDAAWLEGWSLVSGAYTTNSGVWFFCVGDAPTVNIPVIIQVWE